GVPRVSVACRGCSVAPHASSAPAKSSARGPLSLTTPSAPRPAGVAMATMVSSAANMVGGWWLAVSGHHEPLTTNHELSFCRDDDGLEERVADAFRCHGRIFRDGQVHD